MLNIKELLINDEDKTASMKYINTHYKYQDNNIKAFNTASTFSSEFFKNWAFLKFEEFSESQLKVLLAFLLECYIRGYTGVLTLTFFKDCVDEAGENSTLDKNYLSKQKKNGVNISPIKKILDCYKLLEKNATSGFRLIPNFNKILQELPEEVIEWNFGNRTKLGKIGAAVKIRIRDMAEKIRKHVDDIDKTNDNATGQVFQSEAQNPISNNHNPKRKTSRLRLKHFDYQNYSNYLVFRKMEFKSEGRENKLLAFILEFAVRERMREGQVLFVQEFFRGIINQFECVNSQISTQKKVDLSNYLRNIAFIYKLIKIEQKIGNLLTENLDEVIKQQEQLSEKHDTAKKFMRFLAEIKANIALDENDSENSNNNNFALRTEATLQTAKRKRDQVESSDVVNVTGFHKQKTTSPDLVSVFFDNNGQQMPAFKGSITASKELQTSNDEIFSPVELSAIRQVKEDKKAASAQILLVIFLADFVLRKEKTLNEKKVFSVYKDLINNKDNNPEEFRALLNFLIDKRIIKKNENENMFLSETIIILPMQKTTTFFNSNILASKIGDLYEFICQLIEAADCSNKNNFNVLSIPQ